MKILHTSDWHLGRQLYMKKRHEESEKFLNWLLEKIDSEKIDALLVAGDVFDTTTPGNRAQELYYSFLGRLTRTSCRHAVIIGGNHDSPSFLDAPKKVLDALNIHVISSMTGNMEDEIIILKDRKGNAEAVVCAVPYLRDGDVRRVSDGETMEEKSEKLLQGISAHYREVSEMAQKTRDVLGPVPIIGMGHLFTRNARTTEGDGVRELYIGTLAHVDQQSISGGFDYLALGHLHMAQCAEGTGHVRYSGSPIPMGFAEAGQEKKVITVDFATGKAVIAEHTVPCFQELVKVTGDLAAVKVQLSELAGSGKNSWLEVEITSAEILTDVTLALEDVIRGSALEILRIKSLTAAEKTLERLQVNETLETLDPGVVFVRCLEAFPVPDEEKDELTLTFRETLDYMQTLDINEN